MRLPDWRGRTVVCIASGPSLTPADCELVRTAGLTTVVTNTTFRLCPWADALYAFDVQWWNLYLREVRETFKGRLFSQTLHPRRGVECVRAKPDFRSFHNSGACAVSMAIAFGSRRIVLLGYDCQATGGQMHHHGDHPAQLRNCDTIALWPAQFAKLAKYAERKGAAVLNATRESALTCFPRVDLAVELT